MGVSARCEVFYTDTVKWIRLARPRRAHLLAAAGLVLAAAAIYALWLWFRPRTVDVCVVTDYSFRQRPNWQELLAARFEEANRIFSGTGVRWNFRHADEPDPTARLRGMEERRQKLVRAQCQAELILGVTGQPESRASGNAPAFAHTAMIVDDRKRADAENDRLFAQGLAALFGVPADARGAGTLMTNPPESDNLPKAARKLIGALKRYNFTDGAAPIDGEWRSRALSALTRAYEGRGSAEREARRAMALALAADQLFPGAIRQLSEVVTQDPDSLRTRLELGTMYMQAFQPAEAVPHYRVAAQLDPDNAPNRAALAIALANSGRADDAVEEFQAALRIDPRFAAAQSAMAFVLSQQLGRIDESIAAYRTAIEMNPNLSSATEGLARALDFKARSAEQAAAQRRNAQQSANAETHVDLGLAEARAGNVEAGVRALRRAIELDPGNGRAHTNLAILAYLQKDYDGALRETRLASRAGYDAAPALVEAIRKKAGALR